MKTRSDLGARSGRSRCLNRRTLLARSVFAFALGLCLMLGALGGRQAMASGVEGTDALKYLVVQDGGRLKPYDTFAREALQLVHGKQKFNGRPAVEIVTTWLLAPQLWQDREFVVLQHGGLKEALGLPKEKKYFSPTTLLTSERIGLVFQELVAKRESKEKLNPYFQAVQTLENQLGLFHMISRSQAPRVAPRSPPPPVDVSAGAIPDLEPAPTEASAWRAPVELDGELKAKFTTLARAFIKALPAQDGVAPQPAPEASADTPTLAEAVAAFSAAAQAANPALYGAVTPIRVEVHYNDLHPFQVTWILYLIAALAFAFAWNSPRRAFYVGGWVFLVSAFLMNTYGFGVRVYLTGRPPVSNMYETVVWVAWGTTLFAMIFEAISRKRFVGLAGAATSTLCLITADMAPAVLDKSLQPLEPVLRSTLWLTVHVLTITISYAAFFLAWALGLMGLTLILRGDGVNSERLRGITQSCYRAIQIGVVLLAAGTILGGVWADYSWGRFWGWDPKETWAFIALLGYLALLHARLVGWVQNFGMLAGAIASASLVIMAWYGVNFVLGAGLHSYGFGAGGVEYVSAFVALQFLYIGYVAYVHRARSRGAIVKSGAAKGEGAA